MMLTHKGTVIGPSRVTLYDYSRSHKVMQVLPYCPARWADRYSGGWAVAGKLGMMILWGKIVHCHGLHLV